MYSSQNVFFNIVPFYIFLLISFTTYTRLLTIVLRTTKPCKDVCLWFDFWTSRPITIFICRSGIIGIRISAERATGSCNRETKKVFVIRYEAPPRGYTLPWRRDRRPSDRMADEGGVAAELKPAENLVLR